MDIKRFWLRAGEDEAAFTPNGETGDTQINPEGLEPIWDVGYSEPDEPDEETLDLNDETDESDESDEGTPEEEDDDEVDPKALKAAEKKIQQKQMEALLNDPKALQAHLDKLKGEETPAQSGYQDPDYTAELNHIDKEYQENKELNGEISLSLLLGEQFLSDHGIEDRDATPLLMKAAKVANAGLLRDVRTELAETKMSLKVVIEHLQNAQTQTAKQQTESKVVTFIKTQLPDYATNTKTQVALETAFTKVVEQSAKETAELMGGNWNSIAQEMVKNPVTYNNLLRTAILKMNPGGVKSASRSGMQTGVASKPGPRRQTQSHKPIDPRDFEPDWTGFL